MSDDPPGIEPSPADEPVRSPPLPGDEAHTVFSALVRTSYEYQGPVPPPAYLREYEEICPGSAQQMFTMAEGQATHRQELEAVVIMGKDRRATHGLYIGGLLALIVLVLAFVLILTGRSVAGFGILIGEAATLAGVFVYGRSEQRREREAKARLAPPRPFQPSLPFQASDDT